MSSCMNNMMNDDFQEYLVWSFADQTFTDLYIYNQVCIGFVRHLKYIEPV